MNCDLRQQREAATTGWALRVKTRRLNKVLLVRKLNL